jgi:hypothetical protein
MGLAETARDEFGFSIPERVSQNCELCYLTRSFLHQFHPEIFGPEEVYAGDKQMLMPSEIPLS